MSKIATFEIDDTRVLGPRGQAVGNRTRFAQDTAAMIELYRAAAVANLEYVS